MTEVYELYRAGERHLAEGDVRQAVEELEAAARLEPEATDIVRLLARAYFKRAALGRAETAARAVLETSPTDAETTHLLGRCLLRQGRRADATGWLRLAAAMNPRPEYLSYAAAEETVAATVTDHNGQFEFAIEELPVAEQD
ncbi:MAG TPA: tetratricopeptide repeat protein [Mycobacteriales bacterium]|nr:tetratricopeptide repeat protein [Mycobacteriales bacterium]